MTKDKPWPSVRTSSCESPTTNASCSRGSRAWSPRAILRRADEIRRSGVRKSKRLSPIFEGDDGAIAPVKSEESAHANAQVTTSSHRVGAGSDPSYNQSGCGFQCKVFQG